MGPGDANILFLANAELVKKLAMYFLFLLSNC
jgi:hypothetical protein